MLATSGEENVIWIVTQGFPGGHKYSVNGRTLKEIF